MDNHFEESIYIHHIKEKSNFFKKIIIYGAGQYARGIYKLLSYNRIKISGFTVTNSQLNPNSLFKLDVYGIDKIKYENKDTLFIIGMKKKWNPDVIKTLTDYGYSNYVETPDDIQYLTDFINKYERPVLEVTPKIGCSVHCRYCPQDILCNKFFEDNKRNAFMSFEEFKKCIDKTPNNVIVDFSGFVEPFLNCETINMIKYANSLGRDIALYTTLVGVTSKTFDEIKNIPFYEVVLHVPDIDGLANIPMTEEYFSILNRALMALKPNGEPFIDTANCQGIPHPDVVKYTSGKITIFSDLIDRAGNLEDSELYKVKDIKGKISCKRAKNVNHFVLLPDGSLVLCCNDFGMQHILGNLLKQSYEEIIDGEIFNGIKLKMQSEGCNNIICRSCTYASKA